MSEQERQEHFIENWGRNKCDELYRLWKNTYPKYCSLNDEYPEQHTKEEVFESKAKEQGFSKAMVKEFYSL